MIWSFITTIRRGGGNVREKFGCDYYTKSLVELSINVIIFKGDLTENVFFNRLCKEGAK